MYICFEASVQFVCKLSSRLSSIHLYALTDLEIYLYLKLKRCTDTCIPVLRDPRTCFLTEDPFPKIYSKKTLNISEFSGTFLHLIGGQDKDILQLFYSFCNMIQK